MNREFSFWKINKKEKARNGIVLIEFLDRNNRLLETKEFPVISEEQLYKQIDKTEAIILDGVFIENFSLKEYRQSRKMNENKRIHLSSISIQNSVITHSECVDLSNTEISELINFNHSVFLQKTDFSKSVICSELCTFEYTLFKCGDFDISNTKIEKAELSFKNAIFDEGVKNFQNLEQTHGGLNFINTNFGVGDVLFSGSKFGKGRKNFKVASFEDGRVDFNNVYFNEGEAIFEKTNFGDGVVNFRSTKFENGKIEFMSAVFGVGDINFVHTDFGNGAVSFKNVNFKNGKVSFKLAEFGKGKVDFHFSEFGKGDLIFDRTNFGSDNVDFRAVNFGIGRVNFNRCKFFHGELSFEASELNKSKFYLSNCLFEQANINMETLNFQDSSIFVVNSDLQSAKVSFKKSKIFELHLSSIQLDNYVDLRLESCQFLDLSNTVVKGIIDLTPVDYDTKIDSIDFSGMRLLGRIYIDWTKSNLKELVLEQNTSYFSKAEQFRILKENFSIIGQYNSEDDAYVEFKRLEAKALLFEKLKSKNKLAKAYAYLDYGFKYLIFDKVGRYATDPVRVLISMGFTYIFFTFLYIVLPFFLDTHIISSLFEPGDPRNLSEESRAFYHSAITFLTIGYGDYYPSGISRWISSIEGFIGLFLMSYFTVAFVRKILR